MMILRLRPASPSAPSPARWLACLCLVVCVWAQAAPGSPGNPVSPGSLPAELERYLRQQAQEVSADLRFQYSLPDASALPACPRFSFATPPGARNIGRSSVVIRCPEGDPNWSLVLPVQIQAFATYLVSARAIPAGQPLNADDLATRSGDLGLLPVGVLTQPEQAIGQLVRSALAAGQALRPQLLKAQEVIRAGQNVKVIALGQGFEVSNNGVALNAAAVGGSVRVRLANGQVVTGIATAGGLVRLGS